MPDIRTGAIAALCAALSVGAAASPRAALAQTVTPTTAKRSTIDAKPKGTIGLGILGAEVGLIVPALAGLDKAWALTVFPIVGAGAGAAVGWFAIDDKGHSKAAVGVLVGSIAMFVPTVVATVALTRYKPGDEKPVAGVRGQNAVQAVLDLTRAQMDRAALGVDVGTGALRLTSAGLELRAPGVSIAQTYTDVELEHYGGNQHAELHVALFSGVF
ncbi:MAG: hypothetical protein KC543_09885 [Myxococcales bacterium]|nr:hypothetical protein [Myxococcales bacterium]